MLSAYWMRVAENREAYAKQLSDELESNPVVVLVIRDTRFTNPNALLEEFVELIAQHRELCEQRIDRSATKCGFVLLSRTELAIPQISSPVALPEWFPLGGGTTISMVIEDLSWTVDAPLSVPEVKIGELSECLFELEETLIARIDHVLQSDHRRTNGFLDVVRREDTESLAEILKRAREHCATVTTPAAFRPSLRGRNTIVSRLWGAVQECQPDKMAGPSKCLADALDLPESFHGSWHESLASVLRRPSGGEALARSRFARNVFVTAATACQLITAAAHSDDYSHYPLLLLRSGSLDLRTALADAESLVRGLGN